VRQSQVEEKAFWPGSGKGLMGLLKRYVRIVDAFNRQVSADSRCI
jgi:hypothetical protein